MNSPFNTFVTKLYTKLGVEVISELVVQINCFATKIVIVANVHCTKDITRCEIRFPLVNLIQYNYGWAVFILQYFDKWVVRLIVKHRCSFMWCTMLKILNFLTLSHKFPKSKEEEKNMWKINPNICDVSWQRTKIKVEKSSLTKKIGWIWNWSSIDLKI